MLTVQRKSSMATGQTQPVQWSRRSISTLFDVKGGFERKDSW